MDIVDVALGEVSTVQGGERYIRWFGGFGMGTAWCSIFVSWCAAQARVSESIIPKTASTTEGMVWFRQKNLFSAQGTYKPKRGDIIFFKTGMSHVGIVVDSNGNTVNTVEGNSSNQVAKRTYPLGHKNITGYGTPRYVSGGGQNSINQTENQSKEITDIKVVYSTGGKPEPKRDNTMTAPALIDQPYELLLQHEGQIQIPVVMEGVTLSRERRGSPAKLAFSVLKNDGLNFQEGDPVSFKVRGQPAFYGYVFQKSRNSDGWIKVTAYDQIRYFKNHDTMKYEEVTAGELLQRLAADYGLHTGNIDAVDYKLSPTLIDDKAIIDILEDALDITLIMTGKMYVLYDDFGKLTLKDADSMALDILINEQAAEDFDYSSSIDSSTYNKIRIGVDNGDTGIREIYETQDGAKVGQWGVLQKYVKQNSAQGIEAILAAYLKLYNRKTRSLSIKNVMGDIRVRGGSKIAVVLDLGDIALNQQMMVESVTHSLKENEHLMDITLRL